MTAAASQAIPHFKRVERSQSWVVISSQDSATAPRLNIDDQEVIADGHGIVEDVVVDFFDETSQLERCDASDDPIIRVAMHSYADDSLFTTRIHATLAEVRLCLPRASQCQQFVHDKRNKVPRQCKNKTTHIVKGVVLCWRHRPVEAPPIDISTS